MYDENIKLDKFERSFETFWAYTTFGSMNHIGGWKEIRWNSNYKTFERF